MPARMSCWGQGPLHGGNKQTPPGVGMCGFVGAAQQVPVSRRDAASSCDQLRMKNDAQRMLLDGPGCSCSSAALQTSTTARISLPSATLFQRFTPCVADNASAVNTCMWAVPVQGPV